jgi:hypothetical protein
MTANTNLHMNACALLGCDISNVSASSFLQKKEDDVFSYVYQLVESCLFANIGRKARTLPELIEEDDADISKLPPEEILLRWVNYHLKAAGSQRLLTNFSTDIQDSECYHTLLHRLVPHRWDLNWKSSDPLKSAEAIVTNAQKLGFAKFLRAKDISEVYAIYNLILSFRENICLILHSCLSFSEGINLQSQTLKSMQGKRFSNKSSFLERHLLIFEAHHKEHLSHNYQRMKLIAE